MTFFTISIPKTSGRSVSQNDSAEPNLSKNEQFACQNSNSRESAQVWIYLRYLMGGCMNSLNISLMLVLTALIITHVVIV